MADTAVEITAELVSWLGVALPDLTVSRQPLGARERAEGVDLRLLRATPRQTPRGADAPMIVDLDYLATVKLSGAEAEQRAVTELVFAAMDRPDLEVLGAEDIGALCAALGVEVAAGVVIRTPLLRERVVKTAPRVRKMDLQVAELGVVAGQVLGPEDTPIAGASVTAVGLDRFVQTDRDGRFRITAAPAAKPLKLVVRARGARAEGVATPGQTLTLRLPLED